MAVENREGQYTAKMETGTSSDQHESHNGYSDFWYVYKFKRFPPTE